MREAPVYWARAKRELARNDPVMRAIIRANPKYSIAQRGDAFFTLARSIVGQQISVKAAQSVWDRLAAAAQMVNPDEIASMEVDALRACGLSARKVEYLMGLCEGFRDGRLRVADWPAWEDQAIIDNLIEVRGIGRWTAEMFLMFHLLRPNVLPLDDLGLRNAMQKHYGTGRELSVKRMRDIARPWAPWCSVATWYLWRSQDPVPVDY
ncbi:MAG: DNA-3-methyladenine glycosylase family protein [Burkholderiales bacterium]